jgi:hypothetical protein
MMREVGRRDGAPEPVRGLLLRLMRGGNSETCGGKRRGRGRASDGARQIVRAEWSSPAGLVGGADQRLLAVVEAFGIAGEDLTDKFVTPARGGFLLDGAFGCALGLAGGSGASGAG